MGRAATKTRSRRAAVPAAVPPPQADRKDVSLETPALDAAGFTSEERERVIIRLGELRDSSPNRATFLRRLSEVVDASMHGAHWANVTRAALNELLALAGESEA